jgi:hypothetical protein
MLVVPVQKPVVAASSLLANLVAYWKMDEANGGATDAVAGLNNLSSFPGTVPRQTGIINNAAGAFTDSGGTGFLFRGSTADLAMSGSWTANLWLDLQSNPANNTEQVIFCKGAPTGTDGEYLFCTTFTSGNLAYVIYIRKTDNSTVNSVKFGAALTTGSYVMLTTGFDFVAQAAFLQVNGGTRETVTTGFSGGYGFAGNRQFRIGFKDDNVDHPGPSYDLALPGYVDEFGMWQGRVLTTSDVTALYASGAGVTYPFTGVP